MSAILETDGSLNGTTIRRYRTTCKVIVQSHEHGKMDLSQDVVGIGYNKSVKGVGSLNITLVGSHNFLELIHPNDYINLYINRGDGDGWTRVFFGYIDVIKQRYNVNEDGTPNTTYSLKCSDFQKSFEKTQVYFNPYMSGRKDFSGEKFGTINIGGVALMTKGVRASGSPANVIQNLITLLFGFGTQFMLPEGYGVNPTAVARNRAARKKYLLGELGHVAKSALLEAGGFKNLAAQVEIDAQTAAANIAKMSNKQKALEILMEKYQVGAYVLSAKGIGLQDIPRLTELIRDSAFRNKIGAGRGSFNETDPAVLQAIGALDDTSRYTLLDLIDLFTLFEDASIDGWVTDTGIWQKQGSIGQILRTYAHEEINELFFDLRPVMLDPNAEGSDYARVADDSNGNLADGKEDQNGITYVPSVVMREYPFGTIPRLDGSDIQFTLQRLKDQGSAKEVNLGVVEIGSLFSDKPNMPGRHTIEQPSLSIALNATGNSRTATKYLDVARIHSTEIISSDLSRSDSDHFNLMEVYSSDLQLQDMKWMMADVLPLATPINIMRHGLRTKTYITRWAQFNTATASAVERTNARAGKQVLEAEDAIPQAPPESPASQPLKGSEALPAASASITAPVALDNTRNKGYVNSNYGYRKKFLNDRGKYQVTGSDTVAKEHGGKWVFHNGVDINGYTGMPIVSSLDGFVVASAPAGVLGGYGNTVMVKSTVPGINGGQPIYTLYAHLDTRAVRGDLNPPLTYASRKLCCTDDVWPGGTFAPIPIKAGDPIGTMGTTGGVVGSPTKGTMGPHLHYEFDLKLNRKVFPSQSKSATPDVEWAIGQDPNTVFPAGLDNPKSINPQAVHTALGASLPQIQSTEPFEDQIQDAESDMEDAELGDTVENSPTLPADSDAANADQVAGYSLGDEPLARVDNVDTRRQLLRWGILQDHWYQHNLEYLAGQIIMRGAPEIRCGYRLDIADLRLSFYIDGVSHSWEYPNEMKTVLTVSRGQSNFPHPMYVMPPAPAFVSNAGEQRIDGSRLSKYAVVPDPLAVTHAIVFRNTPNGFITGEDRSTIATKDGQPTNIIDAPAWDAGNSFGGKAVFDEEYGDYVIYPEIDSKSTENAERITSLGIEEFLTEVVAGDLDLSPIDDIEGQDFEGPNK